MLADLVEIVIVGRTETAAHEIEIGFKAVALAKKEDFLFGAQGLQLRDGLIPK